MLLGIGFCQRRNWWIIFIVLQKCNLNLNEPWKKYVKKCIQCNSIRSRNLQRQKLQYSNCLITLETKFITMYVNMCQSRLFYKKIICRGNTTYFLFIFWEIVAITSQTDFNCIFSCHFLSVCLIFLAYLNPLV